MKLLIEQTENIEFLKENVNGKKDYYIKGIFLQGEVKNKNGRVYKLPILQEAVKTYTENYINKNKAIGELCHPSEPSINLDRAAILIKELKQENRNKYIDKAIGKLSDKATK